MRPLTDTTPKPLLIVRGKPMIVWHLEKLARAGVQEVVINTSHLAAQFPRYVGRRFDDGICASAIRTKARNRWIAAAACFARCRFSATRRSSR